MYSHSLPLFHASYVISGLTKKIEGFDQSVIVNFFRYRSVSVKVCWHPKKDFHAGKRSNGISSNTANSAYRRADFMSSRLYMLLKYTCGPKDLAHSVLPIREVPSTYRDCRRPSRRGLAPYCSHQSWQALGGAKVVYMDTKLGSGSANRTFAAYSSRSILRT